MRAEDQTAETWSIIIISEQEYQVSAVGVYLGVWEIDGSEN